MAVLSHDARGQTKDTLVHLGSHALYFRVVPGEGVPIVFEAGGGNDGSVWLALMDSLRQYTDAPLVAYDRAGFGGSGIDTANISITTEVADLEKALRQLGYPSPYMFVAHSLGGNYVMRFATDNPTKVKGAVFIDTVSPDFMDAERASQTKNLFVDELEAIKKESIGFYYLVLNYEHTSEVMRRATSVLMMPITVVASGLTPFEGKDRRKFRQSLKRFATEKSNRRYVLVKKAQHHVFYDEPGLVTREILALYDKTVADR